MKNPLGIDLGSLGDAMKNLQDAYSGGLDAMDKAGEEAAKEMKPSHKILVDAIVSAKVESHDYLVDASLEFAADLNSILNAGTGDIAAALAGLDVNLSDKESGQVMEQLGSPRCLGRLEKFKLKKLELHSDKGKIEKGINEKATMLIALKKGKLHFSFESAFALPKLQAKQTIYYAVPSQEKMEEKVVMDSKDLGKKISFSWTEKDKDNLTIKGSLQVKKI